MHLTRPKVLALDLEGTLISTAMSQFPRPHLFQFLERCQRQFSRVVMFTSVPEARFREIAALLVREGVAPTWFRDMEYVHWQGSTKNLEFVPQATIGEVLLVDDLEDYVHPSQIAQWVSVRCFEAPYPDSDAELLRVLSELESRLRPTRFQEVDAVGPDESAAAKVRGMLEGHQPSLGDELKAEGGISLHPESQERSIAAFIAAQRILMDRLEAFVQTPAFERLGATFQRFDAGGSPDWLANWLIRPSFGLRSLPIDIVLEPEGLDRVDEHLMRIILNPSGV